MTVQALNCPNCGAPVPTDATRCDHCQSRLATISCPSCFGMVFQGTKFCPHCGARADRQEIAEAQPRACPRCRISMRALTVGTTSLRECPKCDGLWADAAGLERICRDREEQSAVLGMATTIPAGEGKWEEVRYIPCPICGKLMNRVNFAHCSSVIVDVCKGHGTWFDRDELRRVIEFVRAGGMEKARSDELEELERKRRQAIAVPIASPCDVLPPQDNKWSPAIDLGLSAVGWALDKFLRH